MPYCNRCHMEFIEGITHCSDCGGPLEDTKEEDAALKKSPAVPEEDIAEFEDSPSCSQERTINISSAYIKKSTQYKSITYSGYAFIIAGIGSAILSFLLLVQTTTCITEGFYIPIGFFAFIGIGCLVIGFKKLGSAEEMTDEIKVEEAQTEELIQWFLASHTKKDLDLQLQREYPYLTEDEKNLKLYELIQDILITSRNLPSQAYVYALSDEIYEKLFEEA